MATESFQELKKRQDQNLENAKSQHPELFEREEDPNEKEIHETLAISSLPGDRMKGFVRYFPHDTIVEEVDMRGNTADISKKPRDSKGEHTECILVKGALSQYEAQQNIAVAAGVPLEDVSYAEPKDTNALTFSRVTIKNKNPQDIEKFKIEGVTLKACSATSKAIDPGKLSGNVYTILVRTEDVVDQKWLEKRVSELHVDGCVNYFDIKQFGGLRLLMHKQGAYVVRGEYQRAIEELFYKESPYDIGLIKQVRKEAKKLDHDIDLVIQQFEQYPIIFRIELEFLRYLKEHPEDYIGALRAHENHVKNWIFAYQAYLFNAYVSGLRKQGKKLPNSIPLMFSGGKEAMELYAPWTRKHSTDEFWRFGKDFLTPIIRSKKKRSVKLYPDFYKAAVLPFGVALSFKLPKGANPQVVLMNIFELFEGEPVPEWLNKDEIDLLATLENGSVTDLKTELGEYVERKEK